MFKYAIVENCIIYIIVGVLLLKEIWVGLLLLLFLNIVRREEK